MTHFAAFTSKGQKNTAFMHHSVVELMGLINQLFSLTYFTEPAMLYQLIAVSLGEALPAFIERKKKEISSKLSRIEDLRDIFFCERFNFLRFVKTPEPGLRHLGLERVLDYLHAFTQENITHHAGDNLTRDEKKAGKELIKKLMTASSGMYSTGFVMRIELCALQFPGS